MTKTVTRFLHWCENTHGHGMQEHPEGNWVRYDDVKHLLQPAEPEPQLPTVRAFACSDHCDLARKILTKAIANAEPSSRPIQQLYDDVESAMGNAGSALAGGIYEPKGRQSSAYCECGAPLETNCPACNPKAL